MFMNRTTRSKPKHVRANLANSQGCSLPKFCDCEAMVHSDLRWQEQRSILFNIDVVATQTNKGGQVLNYIPSLAYMREGGYVRKERVTFRQE
jgi:hypothetical protein